MEKSTLSAYIREILKEKKVKEGTCGYDRDAKTGKKFSTPGGMPLKRKTIGEDNIKFSKGEMDKLHKDGKLKKGKHSFKYKIPVKENQLPDIRGKEFTFNGRNYTVVRVEDDRFIHVIDDYKNTKTFGLKTLLDQIPDFIPPPQKRGRKRKLPFEDIWAVEEELE